MMISYGSISDIISPWCKIEKGERWVVNQKDWNSNSTEIRIKSKNELVESDSSCLAKCYEVMFQTLHAQEDRAYTDQDRRTLWQLRLVTREKYETYCNVHWLICKIFELFVGLFTGYSYEKSYNLLIQEIDRRLAFGKKITKSTPQIQISIIDLKAEIKTIKLKTNQIDRFIADRPDLKDLVIKEMATNPHHIAIPEPTENKFDTSDEIGLRASLTFEMIHREHFFNERMCLIERNSEIMETFKKYVQKLNQSNSLPVQVNATKLKIEEVE